MRIHFGAPYEVEKNDSKEGGLESRRYAYRLQSYECVGNLVFTLRYYIYYTVNDYSASKTTNFSHLYVSYVHTIHTIHTPYIRYVLCNTYIIMYHTVQCSLLDACIVNIQYIRHIPHVIIVKKLGQATFNG